MPHHSNQFRTSRNERLAGGCQPLCVKPQTADEDAGVEAIKEAVKLGINFFDTAPFYGSGSAEKVRRKCSIARLMYQHPGCSGHGR